MLLCKILWVFEFAIAVKCLPFTSYLLQISAKLKSATFEKEKGGWGKKNPVKTLLSWRWGGEKIL